ncbi:MAG TPA: hypothetical protein VGU45_11880 [Microvirga sp.]|jgi:hypothetical protein|nr:hypothetical protein [Microvirga sp.]
MGLRKSIYAMACPQCGQDEELIVRMSGWYYLRNADPQDDDDATTIEQAETDDGPYDFDHHSGVWCWQCGWAGLAGDCTIEDEPEAETAQDIQTP